MTSKSPAALDLQWDPLNGMSCIGCAEQTEQSLENSVPIVPEERGSRFYGDPWGNLACEEAQATDRKIVCEAGDGWRMLTQQKLIVAVRDDDAPKVLSCVANGVDQEDVSDALRVACHRGSLTVVRELLSLGISVNVGCRKRGLLPIHLATAAGHIGVCELLLDAAADVEAVNFTGESATSMSSRCGHEEIVQAIKRNVEFRLLRQEGEIAASQLRAIGPQFTLIPRAPQYLAEAILYSPLCDENIERISGRIISRSPEPKSTEPSEDLDDLVGTDSDGALSY